MTPSEQLIKSIIADNADLTDKILEQHFKGDTEIASEALKIAMQQQSVKVLPCIAKHWNGEGNLSQLYRNINRTDNHLDYVDVFSQSPRTVFSGFLFKQMNADERMRNLEMRLAIKPNYLYDEKDILEDVFVGKDAGIVFTNFILSDIDRFKQLSDFLKVVVFEVILYQGRYDILPSIMEEISNINWSEPVNCPIDSIKRSHYGNYGMDNHHWYKKGESKKLHVIMERHIHDTIHDHITSALESLMPILKEYLNSDLYKKYSDLIESSIREKCLLSKAGIDAVNAMLSDGDHHAAHSYFIDNAYRAFLVHHKPTEEDIECATTIANILKEHMRTLTQDESRQLTSTRYNKLSSIADKRRLNIDNISRLKDVFDILLLEDRDLVSSLLPVKRKCPLKSAIANLETDKWYSLAHYYICTNHTLKEAIYAYSPNGLNNEDLAQRFLLLYGTTPYEALEVLSDTNSEATLLSIMSKQ